MPHLKMPHLQIIILILTLFSCATVAFSTQNTLINIQSYGEINYSNTAYFPIYSQGDFESFPFSMGYRTGGYDWDWVNGYQIDVNGNRVSYGDQPTDNPNVYVKQSTEHFRSGAYSAEFHIDGSSGAQHCKLYEAIQDRYPESYWGKPQPEAYYSGWYWFPANIVDTFTPNAWNWRCLMQWADGNSGADGHFPTLGFGYEGEATSSYPVKLRLCNENWWRTGDSGATKWETGFTVQNIPKEQWVHVVVYLKMSSGFRVVDGKAMVWINGQKVVDANIALWNYYVPGDKGVCWGIGNYGTASSPSSIWIDDVQVSGANVFG